MRECDDDGRRVVDKNKALEQKILAMEIKNNEKNTQLTSNSKNLILYKKKTFQSPQKTNFRCEK